MKKAQLPNEEIKSIKKEYDEKIERLLKDQEMSLRVEMDRKLREKHLELKKMIAELEKKVGEGRIVPAGEGRKIPLSDKVEVESDYSIDSMDIDWKVDLWNLLPDYEKKKLYEKEANKVS